MEIVFSKTWVAEASLADRAEHACMVVYVYVYVYVDVDVDVDVDVYV